MKKDRVKSRGTARLVIGHGMNWYWNWTEEAKAGVVRIDGGDQGMSPSRFVRKTFKKKKLGVGPLTTRKLSRTTSSHEGHTQNQERRPEERRRGGELTITSRGKRMRVHYLSGLSK